MTSMEWFWYIIASLGAGIGTGLAGLSAATVMVPILIVLCPSFSSETGAYQATAIALASDILGSAVTTYTYFMRYAPRLSIYGDYAPIAVRRIFGGSFCALRSDNGRRRNDCRAVLSQ